VVAGSRRFRRVRTLDRHLPDFDVNEVHEIALDMPPEMAVERVLALPVTPDRLVRALFRLRGLRGAHLPLERFAIEILGLDLVERTPTSAVAAGRLLGQRVAISFEAEARPSGGSRLITETRVADTDFAFRLYWLVVGPFSALIRRRWLRAVARAR
jgi:hypothetical protein